MSPSWSDTGRARRATIHQLPPELLSDIFNQNMPTYDPLTIFRECEAVEEQRVHAPFRIAAVCAAWRKAALADPRLWTTIIVPRMLPNPDPEPNALALLDMAYPFVRSMSLLDSYRVPTWKARTLARIDTALARSGNLPIDVKFALLDSGHLADFKSLVLRFAGHAHRWRSVFATFLGGMTFDLFFAQVGHETPELRAVKFELLPGNSSVIYVSWVDPQWNAEEAWCNDRWNSQERRTLLYAPKLESLTLSEINVPLYCHGLAQFSVYASGTELGRDIWDTINENRESLRILSLTAEHDITVLNTPLQLPHLKELTIGGKIGAYIDDGLIPADLFTMAQLETLAVYGGVLGRAGLDRIISLNDLHNLQELLIYGLWDLHKAEACVYALATLGKLRRLKLSDCTMPDELIKRMCVASPANDVIWPHLEVLDIGDKIENMLSGRILNMAKIRGPQLQPENGASAVPLPWVILEVQVSFVQELPKLWRDEIAALAQEAARLRE